MNEEGTNTRIEDRAIYFRESLEYIPHILTLADNNPLSPTFGCFDRAYWHYKTTDFPSGMYQENVLPLALVHEIEFPGNSYFRKSSIKNLIVGGMRYAARSSHRDGSCDDYYPNEKALGATVFSLLAMTEAYQILSIHNTSLENFFFRRADWILDHNESGKLSNHQAIAILALYNVYCITGKKRILGGVKEKLELLLSWQHPEGWFQEYEGADPGYQTVTIDALARYWHKSRDPDAFLALEKALKFVVYFLHPDGSFGGEYGSRNTFIAYPAGMEILSKFFAEAARLATGFLKGVRNGTRLFLDDDRMVGHLVSNYLIAYKYYASRKKPPAKLPEEFRKYFPGCQICVVRNGPFYSIISANKGGTCKIFKKGKLVLSNTGPAVILTGFKTGLTNHISHCNKISFKKNCIAIEGSFCGISNEYATTLKLIIFRIFTAIVGKTFKGSQFIRRLLQRRLITGKKSLPIYFSRTFHFENHRVIIIDRIWKNPRIKVQALLETSNVTSIYVAQSNAHQQSRLFEWKFLKKERDILNKKQEVEIRMNIP